MAQLLGEQGLTRRQPGAAKPPQCECGDANPGAARSGKAGMIDLFALVLIHALLALAAWRLVRRNDLDAQPESGRKPRSSGKVARDG